MGFFPSTLTGATGAPLVLGDGGFVRAGSAALVDFLHRYAAPTGARGSVLLMAGGLLVLGFLFTAFLFRSAIVGDLAPVANARRPLPRAILPGERRANLLEARGVAPVEFDAARKLGFETGATLDESLDALAAMGIEARVLQSRGTLKRIRLYRCASCASGQPPIGCEHERGLLAGAFERLTGDVAKVHEVACVAQGAHYCEFEVRHAPLLRLRAPTPRRVRA